MTFASSSCFFVMVIVFAAFALTTGKDAVKNEDLAKQLDEAKRESSKLRQQLQKSNEEVKEIITRESNKLRSEDSKLKREADKLKAEAEKLRKENKKLRRQDKELRQRDAELERKVNELHQDNTEVKKAVRQRNENNTLELQNVVKNSFREMDSSSEFTKIVYKKIKEYLDENKMCVTGQVKQVLDSKGTEWKRRKIEFGHTFQRIPAFAAAISLVNLNNFDNNAAAQLYSFHVANSSAKISLWGNHCSWLWVNWIACL